jgi:isoprenylcysteine carboxyl methyltransferase (ICMT) family protein YpbQ
MKRIAPFDSSILHEHRTMSQNAKEITQKEKQWYLFTMHALQIILAAMFLTGRNMVSSSLGYK